MRVVERKIVSAIIFSKEGKLFQGMKDPKGGGVYADCWHIPGGGIDEGEEPVQALIRELKEELGLDVSNLPIELIDDKGKGEGEKTLHGERVMAKMTFLIYKIQLNEPAANIKLTLDPEEFIEYRWSELSDLKNLKLTPPSVELFTRLGFI